MSKKKPAGKRGVFGFIYNPGDGHDIQFFPVEAGLFRIPAHKRQGNLWKVHGRQLHEWFDGIGWLELNDDARNQLPIKVLRAAGMHQ